MPNPIELAEAAEGAVSLLERGGAGSLTDEVTALMTGGAKSELQVGHTFAIKGGMNPNGLRKILQMNVFPMVRVGATTDVLPGTGMAFRTLRPEVEGAVTKALNLPEGVRFNRPDVWSAAVKPPENFPIHGDLSVLNLEQPGFVKGYERFGLMRKLTVDFRNRQALVMAENPSEGLLMQEVDRAVATPANSIAETKWNYPKTNWRRELHFDTPATFFTEGGQGVQVSHVTSEWLGKGPIQTRFTTDGATVQNLYDKSSDVPMSQFIHRFF